MNKTTLVFALLLASGLSLTPAAEARDIQITVPVRVADLHPTITVGRVQCAALTSLADSGRIVDQAGHTDFTLTNGSYSGDVTVHVTVFEGRMAGVHAWRCELRFARPYEGSGHAFSLEGGAYFREEFRLQPGSERRFQVQGTI
ncbi:MAG: hypothetical protein AB1625_00245 [Acidobacteriota bacterium]